MLTQDDDPENRRLHGFRLRIGGADGEVLQAEQRDQHGGCQYLGKPADHRKSREFHIRGRDHQIGEFRNPEHIEQREGRTIEKAHIGRPAGAQAAFQRLLQRRADILKEGRKDGDRNPGFHSGTTRLADGTSFFTRKARSVNSPSANGCHARVRTH